VQLKSHRIVLGLQNMVQKLTGRTAPNYRRQWGMCVPLTRTPRDNVAGVTCLHPSAILTAAVAMYNRPILWKQSVSVLQHARSRGVHCANNDISVTASTISSFSSSVSRM